MQIGPSSHGQGSQLFTSNVGPLELQWHPEPHVVVVLVVVLDVVVDVQFAAQVGSSA
jgi:hypothetical protein